MTYEKMTESQKSRARDVSEDELLPFVRLCQTVGEYNDSRRMYVMHGDDDAYSRMKAAKSKIRGDITALAERWSAK